MSEIPSGTPAKPGFEIGIMTLGEHLPDALTGQRISAQQRIQEIVKAAQLADQAGLDVFGLGEHHNLDFLVSSVPVVLAAIAALTKRIRLTSAVTVLSTADPVREFEAYASLDLLSGGRAEIMVGRGAFIDSYPLFGFNLRDYERLFPEMLGLLMKLNASERVTWSGEFRSPLEQAEITPRPAQAQIPIWVGVGGTPESAIRAGSLGLPMLIAIIGGRPAQFAPLIDIYTGAWRQAGHPAGGQRCGVNGHFHLARSSQEAIDEFYPYHAHYFDSIGRRLGRSMPLQRSQYAAAAGLQGAYFVGSPQQIIDKIMYQHGLFHHSRFIAQVDVGGQPFSMVARTIELLASEVAPVIRRELAGAAQ